MHIDVLVVGAGLSGSLLSWQLHKEGKRFLVINQAAENTASRVAAGVINPVTGRRYTTTWMVEELIETAQLTYAEWGRYLNVSAIAEKTIIDFFPNPQMRNSFIERIEEANEYLFTYPDQNRFNNYFHYDFGCGEVKPTFVVNIGGLLDAWHKELKEKNLLLRQQFTTGDMIVEPDGIRYGNVTAGHIVFCEGITAADNPWFSALPFSATKGEALLVECNDLPRDHIFKRGMMLVPLATEGLFWYGSNYQWRYETEDPTQEFYNGAATALKSWLKQPYSIVAHKAAVRPATVERRPFVGFHPLFPSIGILNGMGTKGTSLAPFFARQLVQHMLHCLPLTPQADVRRFSRMLSK